MYQDSLKRRIDNWFHKDYRSTFLERVYLLLESDRLFEGQPHAVKYGNTLKHILENISLPMNEDEIIVGSVKEEIPTEEEYAQLSDIYKKWWNIPLEERHKKTQFYYSEGWLKCRPPWFVSYGHLCFDWEKILSEGLMSMKEEALRVLGAQEDIDKKSFLTGTIICYESIMDYIKRYAVAVRMRKNTDLAVMLEHVAYYPARTMKEALQLIWIIILVAQKVCGCGVLNLGRMDQYLLKYLENDLSEGRLTESQAYDLLREFYFKNNEIMVLTDHMSQEKGETKYVLEVAYDDPNYLILGGKKFNGDSGVNALSFLMIKVMHEMKLKNPFIIIRYHKGINQDFLTAACSAMRDNASIVIYNDETMISALKYYGVQEPEVYDYGFFGCNDVNIDSYEGGLRQVWFNFAKALELALNRGDYPMEPRQGKEDKNCQFDIGDRMVGLMTGAYYGIDTGDVNDFKSMDDVLTAFEKQLTYLISEYRCGFETDFLIEKAVCKNMMRIEDCFLKGTVENAESWIIGGTKYHKIIAQGAGLATIVDSLYAIDKLVFQEKKIKLKEFTQILANNFEGHENLALDLRKKLDKFGNDIEDVDKYAKFVVQSFVNSININNGTQYVYQMFPSLHTDRDFTTMGLYVGATPDGRRMKEPISENQSPVQGMDISGLTALLNSISKIPFKRITGGPLNIRIHPGTIKEDEGLENLRALLETYMQKGGMQVQINVVDVNTLRKAQNDPERYRNLCVRVTGYSAFFVEMGQKAQEELISRTEHLIG